MMASPRLWQSPTFLEWDGTTLTEVPGPPNAPIDGSYYGNMLMLPTGQILLTDFSKDIEIYTPSGTYEPACTKNSEGPGYSQPRQLLCHHRPSLQWHVARGGVRRRCSSPH